jgi:capsular polysaccharide biosynthesis protein
MNKEINIDLRRCIKAIINKWWLMVIVGFGCYGIAYLITNHNTRDDEFTAETTVYSIEANNYSSLTIYSDIIYSTKVCEKAANSLGKISGINAEKIKAMISVKDYSTSLVLGISATAADENLSIMVANAVAASFIEEVNNIKSDNSVRLLDKAANAELSYDSQVEQLKLRLFTAIAGIFILCCWISIREIFTRKIYNLSDMKMDGEIDIIGIVPVFKKKMEGDKIRDENIS